MKVYLQLPSKAESFGSGSTELHCASRRSTFIDAVIRL